MGTIIWEALWAVAFFVGIGLASRGTSRSWRIAGAAYVLGGVGFGTYFAIDLTGALDPPVDHPAVDIAAWFAVAGFLSVVVAMPMTLVALGRTGRRRFAALFAAATLAIGTYEFWTSNWAARTGSPAGRCADARQETGPGARIQRVPPGVWCPGANGEVFVEADAICWLALAGWSVFWSLMTSFPLMGLGWASRRWARLLSA
jgi:hypothetical protein